MYMFTHNTIKLCVFMPVVACPADIDLREQVPERKKSERRRERERAKARREGGCLCVCVREREQER